MTDPFQLSASRQRRKTIICQCCMMIIVCLLTLWTAPVSNAESSENTRPASIRVLMHDSPGMEFLGILIAHDLGYFEQAGLPPVSLFWNDGSNKEISQLCSGKMDFVIAWMSEGIEHRMLGHDVTGIALLPQGSSACFLIRTDLFPDIKTPADLAKKKIAVWSCNQSTPAAFLAHQKIKSQLIQQRSNGTMLFSDGLVEATFANTYSYAVVTKYMKFRNNVRVMKFSDFGCNYPENTVFCRDSFLRCQPELCRKFIEAVFQGMRLINTDPQKAMEVLSRYYLEARLFDDHVILLEQLSVWRDVCQLNNEISKIAGCDKKRFEELLTDMAASGLVDRAKIPPFEKFFVPILDDEVYRSLTKKTVSPASSQPAQPANGEKKP